LAKIVFFALLHQLVLEMAATRFAKLAYWGQAISFRTMSNIHCQKTILRRLNLSWLVYKWGKLEEQAACSCLLAQQYKSRSSAYKQFLSDLFLSVLLV